MCVCRECHHSDSIVPHPQQCYQKKYVAPLFSSGGCVMTNHMMLYLQGGERRPYAVFLYAREVLITKIFHSEPFSNIFGAAILSDLRSYISEL